MENNIRIIRKYINIELLRVCAITTFIIGMIAHGYVFLNAMYAHDAVAYGISKDIIGGIVSGTARITPFASIWNIFMAECRTTWLAGIIILICYSLSSYLVCETLKVDNRIFIILISGIMIVTPTTIAANTYTVDCGNSFTLLFSCLSAFLFFRKGLTAKIFFALSMVIAVGSYGPFISVIFTIVLIRLFCDYYCKNNLSEYLISFGAIVLSCMLIIGFIVLLSSVVGQIGNAEMQLRVKGTISASTTTQTAVNTGSSNIIYNTFCIYICKFFTNFLNTVLFYLPQGIAYRLGMDLPANSFFVENKVLLFSFYVATLLCIYTITKESINRRKISIVICFIVTVLIMLMAIDIYGAITWSHLLMRYAYIAPWLLIISIANIVTDSQSDCVKLEMINKNVAYLLGVITIISGIYLANEVYAKEEAVYKSGLLLANRVADHLEAVDGYVPGETKVYIVGNLRDYYAPVRGEFNFVRDMTGVGSPYWDTAIPLYWSFMGYMKDQVGIIINYAVSPPFDYVYDAEGYADILVNSGYEINKDEFISDFEITGSFPNQNCYFWCNDILVFKLSEGLNEYQ